MSLDHTRLGVTLLCVGGSAAMFAVFALADAHNLNGPLPDSPPSTSVTVSSESGTEEPPEGDDTQQETDAFAGLTAAGVAVQSVDCAADLCTALVAGVAHQVLVQTAPDAGIIYGIK